MTGIKVVCDPYQESTQFFIRKSEEDSGVWEPITSENSPDSKLIRDKIVHGFFPFHAEDIVSTIYNEYRSSSGKIEIEFDGTDDDFRTMQVICSGDAFKDKVTLIHGQRRKESAKNCLPKINTIFREDIEPLIREGVTDESREKVEDQISKFKDASAEVIPICIMGSYSVGKSTFINALIGAEVMPSAAAPMTAKIMKIEEVTDGERAAVSFEYLGDHMRLEFGDVGDSGYAFSEDTPDNALKKALSKELDQIASTDLSSPVRKTLELLNAEDHSWITGERGSADDISTRINVEIPFRGPMWKSTDRRFVIFDTPGANSSSHQNHLRILKDALKGFSNGLPIFVTTWNELDTNDNDELQKTFKGISELDSRFTLIVVNRADEETLPAEGWSDKEQSQILAQGIPDALYSGGIYFVSSILGLGYKTGGHFIDRHCGKIFDQQKESYSDPGNRYYTKLFVDNILPEPMKTEAILSAAGQSDRLYANCGMYSIEHAIQTFAVQYSSYNKCQQAYTFLKQAVEDTDQDIEATTKKKQDDLTDLQNRLDTAKNELNENLQAVGNSSMSTYGHMYNNEVMMWEKDTYKPLTEDMLKESQEEETEKVADETGYDDIHAQIGEGAKGLRQNLSANAQAFKDASTGTKKLEKVGHILTGLGKDAKNVVSAYGKDLQARRNVDAQVSQNVTEAANNWISQCSHEAQEEMQEKSQAFWRDKNNKLRDRLVEEVMGTDLIDENKKHELSDFIYHYQPVDFEQIPIPQYDVTQFRKFLNVTLNLKKMAAEYTESLWDTIHSSAAKVSVMHRSQFNSWKDQFIADLQEHVTEYNPDLKQMSEEIQAETARIEHLSTMREGLSTKMQDISSMLEWKNR